MRTRPTFHNTNKNVDGSSVSSYKRKVSADCEKMGGRGGGIQSFQEDFPGHGDDDMDQDQVQEEDHEIAGMHSETQSSSLSSPSWSGLPIHPSSSSSISSPLPSRYSSTMTGTTNRKGQNVTHNPHNHHQFLPTMNGKPHRVFCEQVMSLVHAAGGDMSALPSKTTFLFTEEDILANTLLRINFKCPQLVKDKKAFLKTVENIVYGKEESGHGKKDKC